MVIVAVIYFTTNYKKFKSEISILISQEINGIIKSMKDENRGSYFLEIQTTKEDLKIHSLPIAWEVKKFNIQIGDSVSKEANSKIMIFYKLKNGVSQKLCEFEM